MEIEITDANVAQYEADVKPLVIDFSATWCGPCKKMAPIVADLAERYADQVNVGKCDVDDNFEVTAKYGVRNIPTIVFIKGGQLVDRLVGAVPATEVEAKLKALL